MLKLKDYTVFPKKYIRHSLTTWHLDKCIKNIYKCYEKDNLLFFSQSPLKVEDNATDSDDGMYNIKFNRIR